MYQSVLVNCTLKKEPHLSVPLDVEFVKRRVLFIPFSSLLIPKQQLIYAMILLFRSDVITNDVTNISLSHCFLFLFKKVCIAIKSYNYHTVHNTSGNRQTDRQYVHLSLVFIHNNILCTCTILWYCVKNV